MSKDINRIKTVLCDKKKTGKWLAEQLKVSPTTVSKCVLIPPNQTYILCALSPAY